MKWTRKKPSESGWYWFHGRFEMEWCSKVTEGPMIVIVDYEDQVYGVASGSLITHPRGLWYGPLDPPPLPDGADKTVNCEMEPAYDSGEKISFQKRQSEKPEYLPTALTRLIRFLRHSPHRVARREKWCIRQRRVAPQT